MSGWLRLGFQNGECGSSPYDPPGTRCFVVAQFGVMEVAK
jgi:hypothetical protein